MLVKTRVDASVDFVQQVIETDDVASRFKVAENALHQLALFGLLGLCQCIIHASSVDNRYLGVA